VQLPYANGPSPPERYFDLRRFWSDLTISVLEDLENVRQRNVPHLPAVSNLWDTAGRRGFDYLSSNRKYVNYGAEGFYPSNPLDVSFGAMTVKGDLSTPLWFNEFTSGGGGTYGGPKGVVIEQSEKRLLFAAAMLQQECMGVRLTDERCT
jgi:beta-galactosidase